MIPGAVECDRLFVYGTLRRGLRLHYHLKRLGAEYLRNGKISGELFDLGSYPGARPSAADGKWVHGEVFQLRNPARDFTVLDEVEEFIPGAPERSQFIRSLVDVIEAGGRRQSAWIYWLSPHFETGREIVSGDYGDWLTRTGIV